jgi:predicted amidohydrolase
MNKISVLQIDSVPGDTLFNLNKIDKMLDEIEDPDVRMAVFCEYGTSGYCTDQSLVARPIPGETVEALEKISKAHNIWLSGGTSEAVDNLIANTSVMISPVKGMVAKYRKMHPFGDEYNRLAIGDEPGVVETELGRVGLTICFDFIFPELSRILALKGAEIILNSTFWFADSFSEKMGFEPATILALARTRALENSVYTVMACRTGEEDAPWGGKVRGMGHSSIVSPSGKTLAQAGIGEMIISAEIDMDFRDKWIKSTNYLNSRRTDVYGKYL